MAVSDGFSETEYLQLSFSVLERLTGALKASGKPKALGEGPEEVVEGGEDSGESA